MFFIFRPRGLSYLTVGVSRTSVAAESCLKCHRRVFKETFKCILRLAQLRRECSNPATIKQYRQSGRQPTDKTSGQARDIAPNGRTRSLQECALAAIHENMAALHRGGRDRH